MTSRSLYILLPLMVTAVTCLLMTGCEDEAPATPPGAGGPNSGGGDNSGVNNGEVNNGDTNSGDNSGVVCVDLDGDSFGDGCTAGPDCNDADATIQICDCAVGDFAGCACPVEGASEDCYDGAPVTSGVGTCTSGTRTCSGGTWTSCRGQILPRMEICDTRDDDCDGVMDEGAAPNPCGTCDDLCGGSSVGQGGDTGWGVNEDNSKNVVENDQGGIELTVDDTNFDFLYIANDAEATVSKIDTVTGREEARYISALRVDGDMPDSAAGCQPGNCPSRTAVDLRGDVWVGNRAFDFTGSVTKISNKDCVDENGNGTIDTSSDVDGDGRIDRGDPAEYLGENDECILFTVTVGGNDGLVRALAIDPFTPDREYGSVWVGLYNERRYYQLSGRDGSLLRTVDVPHQPYGAVMDRFGVLWSVTKNDPDQVLVSIQSATGQVEGTFSMESTNGCRNSYGVSIDGLDNVWIAGRECSAAFRYTPATGGWLTVDLGVNEGRARGITADRDGWIYVGLSNANGDPAGIVSRFRAEDGSQRTNYNATADAQGSVGVGLDAQGKVWAVNRGSDNATRIDPATGAIEVFRTGEGPYTYSDFTGYLLRNFTAPSGHYRRVFQGCPGRQTAVWKKLVWDADTQPGANVVARVRSGSVIDDLVTAPELGPFDSSPADLAAAGVPNGSFLLVELELTSDTPGSTPIVWDLEAIWECLPVE